MTTTAFTELLQGGWPYLLMGVFPAGCLALFIGVHQYVQVIGRRLAAAQGRIAELEARLERTESLYQSLASPSVAAPKAQASRKLTRAESGFLADVERYLAENPHGTGMVM
jgi:hypothetical protein